MGMRAKIKGAQFALGGLGETQAGIDPFDLFARWYREAERSGIYLPEAMAVATATPEGQPSVRMMLLKGFGPEGFRFFTNFESRKGEELLANPQAAFVIHWNELQRQVRVEGGIERLSEEESFAYFRSRPLESRLGAWASEQSSILESREELDQRVEKYRKQFAGGEVPLPPYWGGARLVPRRIEFWQGRVGRLHDRICFVHEGSEWNRIRLSP